MWRNGSKCWYEYIVYERIFQGLYQREFELIRLLAYYEHASPNSFHDGDKRQARYLAWKYKSKKDALWRRLEAKYGVPVKHAWEWDDEEEDGAKDDDEAAEDLDDGEEGDEGKGEELQTQAQGILMRGKRSANKFLN